jgi:hypothetical protein
MASPTVKRQLTKMLGYKKKLDLKKNGEMLESMAKNGSNVA